MQFMGSKTGNNHIYLHQIHHPPPPPNISITSLLISRFTSFIELGNQAHLFAIMELACACLDKPEDPFPGKRQYVLQCFQDVKAQQEQIGSLVEQASALLNEILQNEEVDYIKGRQFDNVIREARVLIESCKRRLTGADRLFRSFPTKWVQWNGLRVVYVQQVWGHEKIDNLLRCCWEQDWTMFCCQYCSALL